MKILPDEKVEGEKYDSSSIYRAYAISLKYNTPKKHTKTNSINVKCFATKPIECNAAFP